MLCRGGECGLGGDTFCAARGFACQDTGIAPCIQCVPPGSSSSASSQSVMRCRGDECSLGGTEFCGQRGFICAPSPTSPCIRCLPPVDLGCNEHFDCPSALCKEGACITCTNDDECGDARRCIGGQCLTQIEVTELPAFCGDGALDAGEACDEGSENADRPNARCRPDCRPGRCGDGILDTPLEVCDDGNLTAGDGCSSSCHLEFASSRPKTTLPGTIVDLPFMPVTELQFAFSSRASSAAAFEPPPSSPPSTPDTGPATIAIMAAGAAAGFAWMRRRRW